VRTLPAAVATRITTRSRRLTRPRCAVDDGLAGEDASLGADGAATCASAHAEHGSQSVPESGMSRPHDPQCFTRTTPDESDPSRRTASSGASRKARTTNRADAGRLSPRAQSVEESMVYGIPAMAGSEEPTARADTPKMASN
jgi:hypothetical protein